MKTWYDKLNSGEYTVADYTTEPIPSYKNLAVPRHPLDVHCPTVRLQRAKPPTGVIERVKSLILPTREIHARELLPPHMQPHYGYGKNPEIPGDTDCYEMAVLYNRPYYRPKIGQGRRIIETEFHSVPEGNIARGDIIELYNPEDKVEETDDGRTVIHRYNHCAVVLAPESDLVWSKNGKGKKAGLYLTTRDSLQHLYDDIRRKAGIQPPYQTYCWRDPQKS